MRKWLILLSIACFIVDMFLKRTKVEKTLICSRERGKEVDVFPITNKGVFAWRCCYLYHFLKVNVKPRALDN